MATLTSLLTDVYTITNRPDLEDATKSAIKSATLKAHRSDYYSKDIYETGVDFTTEAYIQSLDYVTLISNFRAFKYFKRVKSATDTEGQFLTILTPEEILDTYGVQKTDVAYVAGRVLEIKASVSFRYGLLGCYVNPIVTDAGYTSWVADLYPYAIIYEAARILFLSLGDLEEARGMASLVSEEYAILQQSNISDVGY